MGDARSGCGLAEGEVGYNAKGGIRILQQRLDRCSIHRIDADGADPESNSFTCLAEEFFLRHFRR